MTVVSGDLTTDGFKPEYEVARDYLDRIDCERPDRRSRATTTRATSATSTSRSSSGRAPASCTRTACRSSPSTPPSPTSTIGQIGRNRYRVIEEQFSQPADLRIFVLHHHLLPVPGTGRERNVVYDAGDLLEVLLRCRRQPRALRAQARSVRVEARGPVPRHRRHGVVAAAARSHEALLQHRSRSVPSGSSCSASTRSTCASRSSSSRPAPHEYEKAEAFRQQVG